MKKIFLGISLFYGLNSCEKSGEFTPAEDPVSFSVVVLDTFAVETSTQLIDSIVATDITRLLVGNIDDPEFGKLKASAYFQLGSNSSPDFDGKNMVYDSLYLSLLYDGYDFGDPAEGQRFSIREVVAEYWAEGDEVYYSFDRLSYGRNPLGVFDYDPEWNSGDSIAIRLSDDLGTRLFDLMEAGQVGFFEDEFYREFEGLVIVPDGEEPGHIVGFGNSTNPTGANVEDAIILRLYYHEEGEFAESLEFDFTQLEPEIAFSAMEADRSGTPLAELTGENPIDASETGDKTFIQAGAGLQTKIRFPNLETLNKIDKQYMVNTAMLRLEPIPRSYDDISDLPDSLALYLTDKYNEVGNVIFYVSGSTSLPDYAHLQADDEYGYGAYYEFNVTEFVFQQLQDQTNLDLALFAVPTAAEILGGVDRMQIGGNDHSRKGVTLKIYLTKLIE